MGGAIKRLVLIPPADGKRVDPSVSQASTSAAAPRPSLIDDSQNLVLIVDLTNELA